MERTWPGIRWRNSLQKDENHSRLISQWPERNCIRYTDSTARREIWLGKYLEGQQRLRLTRLPEDDKRAKGMIRYSVETMKQNMYPQWEKETSVFSVFFPACTGVTAGANIPGFLADPQKAIPKGTLLLAVLMCMTLYVGAVWSTRMTFVREATGNLTETQLVDLLGANGSHFPPSYMYGLLHNSQVMEISGAWRLLGTAGLFAATLRSALAAFVSTPKVFQAVCNGRLFPYIHVFSRGYSASDEPRLGYVLAFMVALAVIGIGDLNVIAPSLPIYS